MESMQCASHANGLVNMNKKRILQIEEDMWSCKKQRVCVEAELMDCPMETSVSITLSNPQQQVAAVRSRSAQCCPRCLGGEPGHISHILGL